MTVMRALEWDAHQVRMASKQLRDWSYAVDGLCAQFATVTDLSAAWHGEAGEAAAVDARQVAQNIGRLSSMLSSAGQDLGWAADSLDGAQERLRAARAAIYNLGFDLFDLGEDGVLRPPPFSGSILEPGYTEALARYDERVSMGEIYASQVRQALSDMVVAEAQVKSGLENALDVSAPIRSPGWVLVEAAHLRYGGHDDPAVAKALEDLHAASIHVFDNTDRLADLANTFDALSADQVDEVLNEADPLDLGMLAIIGQNPEIVTGSGPVFFTGMDSESKLKIVNKILQSVDPGTLPFAQGLMAPLLEPDPHVDGVKGSKGFKYKSIEAPLFHADGAPVRADDVDQGADGDCWFLAPLGVVAMQHPEVITNNIHQNPNGTYTVTFFPKGKPTEVTVTADVPYVDRTNPADDRQSGSYLAGPSDTLDSYPAFTKPMAPNVSWVLIYEKAFAQLHGGYEGIDGGDGKNALFDLVPSIHVTATGTGHIDVADIQRRLAGGAMIVLGSKGSSDKEWRDKSLGVVKEHVYMVTAADPISGELTLRNPWGDYGSFAAPPVLHLTPEQISKDFDDLRIGEIRP